MVLEMVGARLLAPWLGTSITVWTSLIGVILASLSLGYWLGGRLADATLARPPKGKEQTASQKPLRRHARARATLASLLLMAALFVCITAFVQSFVLEFLAATTLSLYMAAVCAALLLFAVPSVLCGMVSPYAMRLAISGQSHSGTIIGNLNAVSTIGSILGTFLGGFVLIAWFGTREILFGVAVCLLVAALVAQTRPLAPKLALLSLVLLAGFASHSYAGYLESTGSFMVETPYNSMRITEGTLENRPVRLLLTDPGSCQSGAFPDAPNELAFAYTKFYALATALAPRAERVLMLGGGGYSVPKWLLTGQSPLDPQTLRLDVVELDPGMTRVAQSHFWTPANDARMKIFHQDARRFLNHRAALRAQHQFPAYDLIFADVFNSYYTVPFHVGTREAAEKISTLLAPDGIFMMNIITGIEGENGRLFRSLYHAFAEVFPAVMVFPVHDENDGTLLQNVMLMAAKQPFALTEDSVKKLPPHIRDMYHHKWTRSVDTDVPPLADNFAPVERYTLGFAKR